MKEAAELSTPTSDYQVTPNNSSQVEPKNSDKFENDPLFSDQAAPLEENLFEWHFTVRGPGDTDFQVCSYFMIEFHKLLKLAFFTGLTGRCLPWSHSGPCRLPNEAARYYCAHS